MEDSDGMTVEPCEWVPGPSQVHPLDKKERSSEKPQMVKEVNQHGRKWNKRLVKT